MTLPAMAAPVHPVEDPAAMSARRATLRASAHEIAAGVTGTLAVLAVPLSLGLIAYAPLASAALVPGLVAVFITAALGGLLYAAISAARLPAAGPSSATALILAGLVAALVADARGAGDTAGVAAVVAVCGLAVALSGVLQILLAWLGLARLARLVPRPVLAGFMNGVALLILLHQLPLLLGLPLGAPLDAQARAQVQPGALLLGLGTVVVALAVHRLRPRWPATLLALGLGTLAALALQALGPAWPTGPRIGALPPGLQHGLLALPLLQADAGPLLHAHAPAVLLAAVVLALIGALESLLSLQALDQQLGSRHDPRSELQALGLCNLVCGLLGGLPTVMLRARALAMHQAGARRRLGAMAGSAALLLLFVGGAPLLALLPLPVLGGIMVVIALGLIDRWSGRLLRHGWRGDGSVELRSGLAVMLAVCAMTLWLGFAAGVALGVLLSMAIFIARMNRSLLHAQLSAAERPSRRIYPPPIEQRLAALRPGIRIWELEGALFFGNADRLRALAEPLDEALRALVLDLRRVSTLDETGAAALLALEQALRQRQAPLLLCGVPAGSAVDRTLRAHGLLAPRLPDADRATEAAEQQLLGPLAETTLAERPLAESALLHGLDAAQAAAVAARMTALRLFAGDRLFRQGDACDGLYVLALGSVSVVASEGAAPQRFVSISPGMMLGEAALLDGSARSADAVADTFALLYRLDHASLQALQDEQPAIAARLHRNIAVHLSVRLRAASAAWSRDLQ